MLLRRALALSGGDEVIFALTLAIWLLSTAGGSAIGAILCKRNWCTGSLFGILLGLQSLWCGMAIFVLDGACSQIAWTPGVVAGGEGFTLALIVAILPLGLFGGSIFPVACRICKTIDSSNVSYVYLREAVGSFFAATILALFFSHHLNPIIESVILAMIGLAIVAVVIFKRLPVWLPLVLVPSILYLTYPGLQSAYLDQLGKTRSGVKVLDYLETPYGLVEITDLQGQITIYENGLPLASSDDIATIEERADLTLVQHPEPKKVLWISGSLGGGLAEGLKHPSIEQIDVIEINPDLWDPSILDRLPQDATALADLKIKKHSGDARRFLHTIQERTYDIILLNLPGARTARLAKYYTVEAFRRYSEVIKPGGALVFTIPSAEDYIGEDLAELLGSLQLTLRAVFTKVYLLPGQNAIFIAGDQRIQPALTAPEIGVRLKERNLNLIYWDRFRLQDRLSASRIESLQIRIKTVSYRRINRDSNPITFYLQQIFWSQQSPGVFGKILKSAQNRLIPGSLCLLGLWFVLAAYLRLRKPQKRPLFGSAMAVFSVGFSGLALEILALNAYQMKLGSGYRQIGLLIGCYMFGLAMGAEVSRRIRSKTAIFPLLQLIWVLVPLGLTGIFSFGMAGLDSQHWLVNGIFVFYLLLIGVLGGIHFPLATAYPANYHVSLAGVYYALDLLGAALGALLIGLLILPLIGMKTCILGLALLNLAPMLLLFGKSEKSV
ncbi:MAG: hypothetical protein NTW14_02405 [bacterium]|nr:hypothetical protein [bacterium]